MYRPNCKTSLVHCITHSYIYRPFNALKVVVLTAAWCLSLCCFRFKLTSFVSLILVCMNKLNFPFPSYCFWIWISFELICKHQLVTIWQTNPKQFVFKLFVIHLLCLFLKAFYLSSPKRLVSSIIISFYRCCCCCNISSLSFELSYNLSPYN